MQLRRQLERGARPLERGPHIGLPGPPVDELGAGYRDRRHQPGLRGEVGDRVAVTYALALVLQLRKVSAEVRELVRREGGADAAPVERSATVAGREAAVIADVVAVNYVRQTLTLRGPNRSIRLLVPDAAQLRSLTTGDRVHAIYAEAVAVTLRAASRVPGGE
jgi:hypothetical protein